MLLQFSVENFLSFREAGVLSMLAADGIDHPPHMLMEGPEGRSVLRCAAIYGANASGKSNLTKSLDFATRLLVRGRRPGEPTGVRLFKLDDRCAREPARFEWQLALGPARYSYGLELDALDVRSEWLLREEEQGETTVFERRGSSIDIGPGFPVSADRAAFVRFVAEGTRPNQPFLAEARERNVHELAPLLSFFQRCHSIGPATPARSIFDLLRSDERFRSFAGRMLEEAGTGVISVEVEKRGSQPELHAALLADNSPAALGHQLGSGLVDFFPPDQKDLEIIVTTHADPHGRKVPFSILEESDGTQRLLQLAPALYELDSGPKNSLVAIDELERSLHPLLTRAFLQRFLEAGGTSQLLFTTHDTNLLDLTLLSRDAIWFTEKDHAGATALYSLAEYRNDQLAALGPQLEKGYLQGRFGAIPFAGDTARLGWSKAAE